MSYYKIAYESDTIEGLKAIHGSSFSHGSNAATASGLESAVPSPPPQQDGGNADVFSGIMQAPPPASESDTSSGNSSESAFYPPPPIASDSSPTNDGPEADIPPPPNNESLDNEFNEAPPDGGIDPSRQTASDSQKAAKKSSK